MCDSKSSYLTEDIFVTHQNHIKKYFNILFKTFSLTSFSFQRNRIKAEIEIF